MTGATATASVVIGSSGPVSGTGWLAAPSSAPVGAAVELAVFAKISMQLGRDGATSIVSLPELPGWNQGRSAREEIEPSPHRRLIVRGHRTQPGRVVLRRGAEVLGEVAFGVGVETIATSLPSTMQTTIGSRRGDDYLVVEGVEGPSARRWCKLPKLGVLATWDEVERMVLTSRACIVDVSSWTVAFLLQGSRKLLSAMAPRRLALSVLDLSTPSGEALHPGPRPSSSSSTFAAVSPSATLPSLGVEARAPAVVDEESSTAGNTRQVAPAELERLLSGIHRRAGSAPPLDDGNDEGPTKVLPNVDLERLQREIAGAERPASALPLEERPEPGEVTRAFSAIVSTSDGAPVEAAPVAAVKEGSGTQPIGIRAELERRLQRRGDIRGLDLRRAPLKGLSARGGDLRGAQLSEADLTGADLTGANLEGACLDGAKLDGARLDDATLLEATFECASMVASSMRSAKLEGSSFAGADLRGADLRGAEPRDAFVGSILDGARLA